MALPVYERGQALAYVQTKGWKYKTSGDELVLENCPHCGRGGYKCYLSDASGLYSCKYGSCAAAGNFYQLQRHLGDNEPVRPLGQQTEPKPTKSWALSDIAPFEAALHADQAALGYLTGRGITAETAKIWHLGLKTDSKDVQWLLIPYIHNGEIVDVKYRSLPPAEKRFQRKGGGMSILYGQHLLDEHRNDEERVLYMVEGECFPPDAEVFTSSGWQRFDSYDGSDVLQVSHSMNGEFVSPLAVITRDYDGDLVRHEVKGWLSETTEGHNLVSYDYAGRLRKRTASEAKRSSDLTPRAVVLDGQGVPFTDDQIALVLAVSADAKIDHRVNGNRYAHFGLKKARKKKRLSDILERLGISYTSNVSGEYTTFNFTLPEWVPGRNLPIAWLPTLSLRQRELILSELVHWDGNSVTGRNQTEYSSKYYSNASWVQTIAHTSNRCSSLMPRSNDLGHWYKVSILHGKNTSSWQTVKTSRKHYTGKVHCVTVPSGMILVRQEGKVTVSGNCDAITMHQHGFSPVLSTTTGSASFAVEWYDAIEKYNPHKVVICYDSDAAGQKGAEKHVKKFEKDERTVLNIVLPDAKDANEYFQKHTAEDFKRLVQQAQTQEMPSCLSMGSVLDKLEEQLWLSTDAFDGVPSQFEDINTMVGGGYWNGQLVVLSGTSGTGKTSFLLQELLHTAKMQMPTFLMCLEMPTIMMMRKIIEKEYAVPMLKIQQQHIEQYRQDLSKVPLYLGDKGSTLEDVEATIRAAVKRYDLKCVAFDNLNYFVRSIEHEAQEIGKVTKRMKELAVELHIPIIMVSQLRKFDDEQRAPHKGDLKGASAIDQDADSILLLWRRRNKSEVKSFGANGAGFVGNQSPYTLLRVDKARYAAGGESFLYFEGSRSTYRELTPGEADGMRKS